MEFSQHAPKKKLQKMRIFMFKQKQIKKIVSEHLTRKVEYRNKSEKEQGGLHQVKEDVKEFDKTNILRE